MSITSLTHKSNQDLISDLKSLVAEEREVLLELLQHLKELENRRLYLPMGYPSLFAYMTECLGFSEGAAQRRIQAMRLMKSMPEVAPKLKTGAISLSVASQVQGFFQRENKQRKQDKAPLLQSDEKRNLMNQLEGTSSRECERQLARIAPESSLPPEKTRVLTETKSLIQFVAGEALLAKLTRLKALTSHTNPEGKYEVLFERLVELGLDRLDPVRKALRREKSLPNTQKSPGTWAPCGARAPGGSPKAKSADLPPDPIPPKPENPPPTSAVKAGSFPSKHKLNKAAHVSMINKDQGPLVKSNPPNSPTPIQNLKGAAIRRGKSKSLHYPIPQGSNLHKRQRQMSASGSQDPQNLWVQLSNSIRAPLPLQSGWGTFGTKPASILQAA